MFGGKKKRKSQGNVFWSCWVLSDVGRLIEKLATKMESLEGTCTDYVIC